MRQPAAEGDPAGSAATARSCAVPRAVRGGAALNQLPAIRLPRGLRRLGLRDPGREAGAEAEVEFVLGQLSLHERGLEHGGYLLTVGVWRAAARGVLHLPSAR